ncbi:MAG: cation transporter [Nitrospinae bacterium]|nr:cation transporter [Nitrospinota bacterium]MZH40250.1 cation transporter [Nitrospinota bacterium]
MSNCASTCEEGVNQLAKSHQLALGLAFAINIGMFFIEVIYGWLSGSKALFADSLDMLSDAFLLGSSLFVIQRSEKCRTWVAMIKGMVMCAFSFFILASVVYRFFVPQLPEALTMGVVGGLALAANLICAFLVFRYRGDDINMKSAWLCTRNDVLANLGIIVAAWGVDFTQSFWPDLFVGTLISILVFRSSLEIVQEASTILRKI